MNPLWEPDGTQPPPPPRAWNDPVAGLVTGAVYEPEPIKVEVAKPVVPDMSDISDEVRRAVDSMLSEETQEPAAPVVPAPRRQPPPVRVTPGIVPPNPRAGWPRSPVVRQLSGLRVRRVGDRPSPRVRRVRNPDRQSSNTGGMAVIIAMVLVFVLIIVLTFNSLLNTIAALFS